MKHRIGISTDAAPHTDRYAGSVGAFVANFGFIEFISFLWISSLTKDQILIEVGADMQLAARIKVVKKLAERELKKEESKEALALWDRVSDFSDVRNTVCHNPYIYGWPDGKEEKGQPDFAAAMRVRDGLRRKNVKPPPQVEQIEKAIPETAKIAGRLYEIILSYLERLADEKKKAQPVVATANSEDRHGSC